MTDTATLENLDPNTLAIAANVRDVAALDDQFVASVAEHGVLTPVTAVRRTLAARQVGLATLPVYVRDVTTVNEERAVERVVEQIVLNDHRADLTDAQRARGINQLLWTGPQDSPYMPVLQGWSIDDYLHCMDAYYGAGINLALYPLVGVGSICRRQGTKTIKDVVNAILRLDPDMPLHTFGAKSKGLRLYGHRIASADSLAWSFQARRNPPMQGHRHASCANCLPYALGWRRQLLSSLPSRVQPPQFREAQRMAS